MVDSFRTRRAFTLIELLVVVAIIALLISILLPALRGARDAAYAVKEMAACQQLLVAYHAYATENKERVMPPVAEYWWVWHSDVGGSYGQYSRPAPMPTYSDQGERLYYLDAQPYAWRLAPYLNYAFPALITDKQRLSDMLELRRISSTGADSFERAVAWHTSFAMNNDTGVAFVHEKFAGDHPSSSQTHKGIRLTSDVILTDKYMLFATARGYRNEGDPNVVPRTDPNSLVNGYYQILPPFANAKPVRYMASASTTWNAQRPPKDYGYLDLRHDKHAVIGAFDGHVERLSLDKLRQMQRWSNTPDAWDLFAK